MKLLGIDPGTAITGFGVIEAQGQKFTMIDAGVVRTASDLTDAERLEIICDSIAKIIKDNRPDVVSIEKLFFQRNVTTAMTVSQARGVVMLVARQHKLPIYEYTPLQIKQAITGYGKADKAQMQEMVRVLLKLKDIPKPDDCADALAAAICCAMSIR